MLYNIDIRSDVDYGSAINTLIVYRSSGRFKLKFSEEVIFQADDGISHFTDENFTAFVDAIQSDPTLMACISDVEIFLDLFDNENAPTPQKFGEFLGSLLNYTELKLHTYSSYEPTPTNPQFLAALLAPASSQKFPLKMLACANCIKLEGSTQDFIVFAGSLAANQGLTEISLHGAMIANNTPNKINPLLKAMSSLPILSSLNLHLWEPPLGCQEQLSLVCAGSKLKSLVISSSGFSMASAAIKGSTSIQKLHLTYANLKQEGKALGELVATNTVLKELILWSDGQAPAKEEEALCQLAEDLKHNSTITKLGLKNIFFRNSGRGSFQKKMVEMLRDNTTITWFETPERYITDDMKYFVGLNHRGRKKWYENRTTRASLIDTLMSAQENKQDAQQLAKTLEGEVGALNITYEVLHLMPAVWTDSGSEMGTRAAP